MILVTAKFTAAEGKREELIAATQGCIAATREEAGCISYNLYSATDNTTTICFVEEWESPDALSIHMKTAHFNTLIQAGKLLCPGDPQIKVYNATPTE